MLTFNLSSIRRFCTLLLLLVCIVTASGCARPDKTSSTSGGQSNGVTLKGSDTMVQLASTWAEDFMKANPQIQVSVTGGGSGTGISALLNGTTDIATASRSMEPKEKKLADQKGLNLKEVVVGRDAISVVINPDNPVTALSMDQLKDIFTGKITNWHDVGGPDLPILVYSRESSSGTYVFFQEHVLKKQDYATSARLMPATSAIIQAVSSDKAGIGYVGLGYASKAGDKIKVVPVKASPTSTAVSPSEKTVLDETYPIARELYLYLPEKASAGANQFVKYTLSPAGQAVVREAGYIPNAQDPSKQ